MWNFFTVIEISIVKSPKNQLKGSYYEPFKIQILKGSYYDPSARIGLIDVVDRQEETIIIPKKDGSVQFISDFRELNKRIKRKPYPIPKIQDLLLKLEGLGQLG